METIITSIVTVFFTLGIVFILWLFFFRMVKIESRWKRCPTCKRYSRKQFA